MIRSGAAALLGPDGVSLASAYGDNPIYPTNSMSEQMPISQPPAGKAVKFFTKPGSVGVPVAASTAIVSRSSLRPLPRGVEGEIAISGETVIKNYLDNPDADLKSYFYLTLGTGSNKQISKDHSTDVTYRYFLTGDIGVLYLTLAPNSYNCFLFHQMVGQWYFAATRNRHMWNWWRYRKDFYWFSPKPCPVEWYEYFFVCDVGGRIFERHDNSRAPSGFSTDDDHDIRHRRQWERRGK
jgi:acyl-CoA synthetase (AMP-forming)/AMP-acid ligase II